ncbi:MAG: hypothetical protein ACLPY5_03980 [Candidatus Bathyarchaeia archaeon]
MTEPTRAEEVLLAAVRLMKKHGDEFSEWDLTVETWENNKNRWGLPGYEKKFPDHKRVMNEIMARGTEKAAIGRGWLERTRTNHYKVTAAGFVKAASLESKKVDSQPVSKFIYEDVDQFAFHKVFESYWKNPEEPRTWIGAAAFLSLSRYDADTLDKQLRTISNAISTALAWMDESGEDSIRRGGSGRAITRERLTKLQEFLEILQKRFARQIQAIREK